MLWYSTLISLVLLSFGESQNIFLENRSNYDLRSNFCPLYDLVDRKEVELINTLRGKEITVGIVEEINKEDPYVAIKILDEVSRRAGFTYIPYASGYPKPQYNETWTDVLANTAYTYDLAAHRWARTLDRISLGLVYNIPWFNADSILVAKESPPENNFSFWAFSKPFTPGLWLLIVFTIVFSSALFYVFNFIHENGDREKMFSSLQGCIFTGFDSYTGYGSVFEPKSRAERILVLSMAFLFLILISAYTANLATYFIVRSIPETVINDMNDVTKEDLLVCVAKGFANAEALKAKYTNARISEITGSSPDTEQDVLKAVNKGQCDVGLVTMEGYLTYKRDTAVNPDCSLTWVGRRIFSNGAGFALKSSEELCTSLLDSVLDYYLLEMMKDGTTDKIMNKYREREPDLCIESAVAEDTTEDKSVLTVFHMGGAFAFHLCIVVISVIIGLFDHHRQPKEVKHSVRKKIFNNMKSFRRSLRKKKSEFEMEEGSIESSESPDFSFQNQLLMTKVFDMMNEHQTEIKQNIDCQMGEVLVTLRKGQITTKDSCQDEPLKKVNKARSYAILSSFVYHAELYCFSRNLRKSQNKNKYRDEEYSFLDTNLSFIIELLESDEIATYEKLIRNVMELIIGKRVDIERAIINEKDDLHRCLGRISLKAGEMESINEFSTGIQTVLLLQNILEIVDNFSKNTY